MRWATIVLVCGGCASSKGSSSSFEECGPPVRTADWDEDALPRAMSEDDGAPIALDGVDDGQPGVAWSAALAADYQIKVQNPPDCMDGDVPCPPFGYLYDPVTDDFVDDESIHRQLVGTLASLRVYALVRRPELLRSAVDALTLLTPHIRTTDTGDARMGDLGATVLMAMALCELERLTGDDRWATERAALGESIVAEVDNDGSFLNGSALQRQQAHHALWRLYQASGDTRYRDALVRAATHASAHRDDTGQGGMWEWPYLYGLWAHEPLVELYQEVEEDWIPELIFWVADQVVAGQYSDREPGVITESCGWRGGFTPNNGSGAPNWNSTIKLEAVVDAYRMAELVQDDARIDVYGHSATMGAAFLMQSQYRAGDPELSGFANPDRSVGGLPLYSTDPTVRIDIPGHGAIALAKVAELVHGEATPGSLLD